MLALFCRGVGRMKGGTGTSTSTAEFVLIFLVNDFYLESRGSMIGFSFFGGMGGDNAPLHSSPNIPARRRQKFFGAY